MRFGPGRELRELREHLGDQADELAADVHDTLAVARECMAMVAAGLYVLCIVVAITYAIRVED